MSIYVHIFRVADKSTSSCGGFPDLSQNVGILSQAVGLLSQAVGQIWEV